MKRIYFIKLHLYLSGVVLTFLLLMGLSGSLHLFLGDETEKTIEINSYAMPSEAINKAKLKELFISSLKKEAPEYKFDYIKGSETSLITRPTSRNYYSFEIRDSYIYLIQHSPSPLKMLMEFHKGHGARSSRPIMGFLGVLSVLAIISGLWLGCSAKAYRKLTILTVSSGFIIYIILFLL